MSAGTTYYVRAYAVNSAGTGYGQQETRTTLSYTAPTVTTDTVTGITQTTADCGGDVTDDGGQSITARGCCWNTGGSPTTSDSKTSDGTGAGTFVSDITGLSAGTTYYVRAYATNAQGTSYGNQRSFTTQNPA